MFTSVDRRLLKNCFAHIIAAIITALAGAIYECFSHQIYSYFMIYAFLIPLILGALPSVLLALKGKKVPGQWSVRLYNSGVAALTVGSLFEGALEIYGTTNKLITVYLLIGVPLLITGVLMYIFQKQ